MEEKQKKHQISFHSCSRLFSLPTPLLVTLPLDVPLTEGIAFLVRGSGVEFFLESQIFLCLSCVTSEILISLCSLLSNFFFFLIIVFLLNITASAVQISLNKSLETCYFF